MPVTSSSTLSSTVVPVTPWASAPPLTEGVGTPLWWVYRLVARLNREIVGYVERTPDGVLVLREGMARLQRYYDGHHDLPWVRDSDVRAEYQALLNRARSNFMRLVVNVPAERVKVLGLRLPGDDEVADTATWEIWQRNDLDRWFPVAVKTALAQRRAVFSVWADSDRKAKIVVEDPQQVIVEFAPGDPGTRVAGLKLWTDDWTGDQLVNLILPDAVYRYRWGPPPGGQGPQGWYAREAPERNPFGVVTYVPMVNDPGLHNAGVSRIEDVLPVQDRINQTILNRGVAEHLSAFQQKWAAGLEIPIDEDTGLPVQPLKASIDSIWIGEGEHVKFGQFDATDLANYASVKESDLEDISVLTRTPRHVFVHQGQAPSGDAMKSDEAGLVADVKGSMQPTFGAAIREVLGLARKIDNLPEVAGTEIVWGDPEWQTFAQLVDGHTKLLEARVVSRRYVAEKIGMTPATIKRVEAEVMADALLDASLEPDPAEQVGSGSRPSSTTAE
jgi:diadenosine tetraphosphatase ApaH/serine/threonine PP2A family protein phosphatase